MARIVIDSEVFEPVASTAFYETEYERIVLDRASHLFPEFATIAFKSLVESEYGRAKPDLALVDREYRSWWVVEVEMAHHSLTSHVAPQVQILSTARYGRAEADALAQTDPTLDAVKLEQMMKGAQPRVLVIVGAEVPGWRPILAAYGVRLAVAEVFRSPRLKHIVRLNGDYPETPNDVLTFCRLDHTLPRLLRVESPAALPIAHGDTLTIVFEGQLSEWTKIETADRVWLTPRYTSPLRRGVWYGLVRRADQRLEIVERQPSIPSPRR